jgi:prepilin peptidase CpaA
MEISQPAAWFVTVMLVEAAVIDGLRLRVPNWLTFHVALAGLAVAAWQGGSDGLLWSLGGLGTGLVLLLPLYAIGGLGAGDVKLLAAVGAWVGAGPTLGAFLASALVGGLMALAMMAWSRDLGGHLLRMVAIGHEILEVRDPARLSQIAAGRKSSMMLLPYGIPIAVGSIAYFAWLGLLA